jgi:hypothetical protein
MRVVRIVVLALAAILCPAAGAGAATDVRAVGQLPSPANLCTYVVESGLYTCDARMIGRVARETTVVATLYPAKGYLGAPTLTVRSEKGGCTPGKHRTELRVDLRYLYFADGAHWDDKAMSFRTYADCRLKLYDGTDGDEGRLPATAWLDDRASMGKLDGRLWARRADLIAVS